MLFSKSPSPAKVFFLSIALVSFWLLALFSACKNNSKSSCSSALPKLQQNTADTLLSYPNTIADLSNMVFVKGDTFLMGNEKNTVLQNEDEQPTHSKTVEDFYLDSTEVSIADFESFVNATGYVSTAEKRGYSLVFQYASKKEIGENFLPWWKEERNISWKKPFGENKNSTAGNLPVVHVSWFDASNYCAWKGKRLPSETEWEFAAVKGFRNTQNMNVFQGIFPEKNSAADGYEFMSPVKSFEPNALGIYNMQGNVWEWCSDFYHANYYSFLNQDSLHELPLSPPKSYDPNEPFSEKRVIRGGSFLCHESYCSGYRPTARMKATPSQTYIHAGFRCAANAEK